MKDYLTLFAGSASWGCGGASKPSRGRPRAGRHRQCPSAANSAGGDALRPVTLSRPPTPAPPAASTCLRPGRARLAAHLQCTGGCAASPRPLGLAAHAVGSRPCGTLTSSKDGVVRCNRGQVPPPQPPARPSTSQSHLRRIASARAFPLSSPSCVLHLCCMAEAGNAPSSCGAPRRASARGRRVELVTAGSREGGAWCRCETRHSRPHMPQRGATRQRRRAAAAERGRERREAVARARCAVCCVGSVGVERAATGLLAAHTQEKTPLKLLKISLRTRVLTQKFSPGLRPGPRNQKC